MRATRTRTLLSVLLVAALAVGCGGDDSDDALTEPAGVDTETDTADMEGVTEEDSACQMEMAISGTDVPSGEMDVETAFIESGDDGILTGVMASYEMDPSQDRPDVSGDDPQVADGELLYVFELQLDDPAGSLEGGTVFVRDGVSEETVDDVTSDGAAGRGDLVEQRLWSGSEDLLLADTVIEVLEVHEDRVCGFIGAGSTNLTEVTSVTGRFTLDRIEAVAPSGG